MDFILYPDKSIFPAIRCISKIQGSSAYAEGVGFSANAAIEKCRSERIEREYQSAKSISPIGIAAHYTPEKAIAHARIEAIETLTLEAMSVRKKISAIHLINTRRLSLSILKVNGMWFSLARGQHKGQTVYTHACRKSLIQSILHAWIELRSVSFFKVPRSILSEYTKANQLFGDVPMKYEFSFNEIELDFPHAPIVDQWGGRYIAYFKGE